jgi:predicted RNA-binding Zn-ribbon protein involved in translation (DUF1610 family)
MKQKSDKCLYCGKKLEPKTTRQRFCCDKCRVYWNRDNARVKVSDSMQPTNVLRPEEQAKTSHSINTIQEPKIAFYDTPESFIDKINNVETLEGLNIIATQIEKSKFSWDIKQKLQNIGRQVYNSKFKD